jgi:hypothetical protein
MPRYFFHVRDSEEIPDREGIELRGPEEARTQAVIASAEAIKDLGRRFWNSGEWQMLVTDENGATVCVLKFSGGTLAAGRAVRCRTRLT